MVRNKSKRFSLAITMFVLFVVSFSQVALGATVLEEVRAQNGMVAAASPLAAQIGVDILKAGGNAVDAAVATAFAIGVAEPNASGLGGEGFLVIYLPESDRAVSIDYRSAAPAASVEDLVGKKMPSTSWKSVGIPGTVAGLSMALEKYGTMTLAQVMEPSIRLAEEGFAIPETLAGVINDNYEKILNQPPLSAIYLDDMLPPEEGWVLKNPDLAKTMRLIAEQGPDVFYTGEIAKKIVDQVQANDGYLTLDDLANYQAILRWPVRGTYRGYDIISAGPPVGGGTVIEAMQILESFDLASLGYLSQQNIHLTAEAIRIAYRDNYEYYGDPDFDFVPLFDLLSKDYARERAYDIDPDKMTTFEEILPGYFGAAKVAATGTDGIPYESPSTTHISVVDKDHMMVALTQTISSFFGAAVMPEGTGIILNNEMANFGPVGGGTNSLEAGKRMKTVISPTIVLKEGLPFLTIGTPGAGRIISTVTSLLTAIIDHGMSLQEAIEAPRFYVRDYLDSMEYEPRFGEQIEESLATMGWQMKPRGELDLYFGGAQGVLVDFATGELVGGADPRRDGAAIGY